MRSCQLFIIYGLMICDGVAPFMSLHCFGLYQNAIESGFSLILYDALYFVLFCSNHLINIQWIKYQLLLR